MMPEHLAGALGGLIGGCVFIAFGFWRKRELRRGSADHFDKTTTREERRFAWFPLFVMGPLFILLGIWQFILLIMNR